MDASKKTSSLYGFFLASIAILCWGTMFPIGRLVFKNDMINPYALCGMRFILAGLVMLAIDAIKRFRPGKTRVCGVPFLLKDWFVMFGAGVLAITHVVLLCAAQRIIPTVNASMIEALVPIQTFLLSICIGNRPRAVQLAGLTIGFSGCLLMLKILDFRGFYLESYSWGDGVIFLSALCWSAYIVLGRGTIQRLGSWTFTAWSFFSGGALVVPFFFLTPDWVPWVVGAAQWRIVVYYLFVPTILGFACWNAAQKYLSLGTLSFLAYFNPMIAAVGGIFVVHEYLTWEQVLGAVCILGAAWTKSQDE